MLSNKMLDNFIGTFGCSTKCWHSQSKREFFLGVHSPTNNTINFPQDINAVELIKIPCEIGLICLFLKHMAFGAVAPGLSYSQIL